jgi:hypothetical protein
MERERLTRLLEEPGLVAREDLVGLKDLTRRYPWFSGAHLLQALGEEASGEVLQGDTLRTAAAHLPTRSVLFDAVNTLPATPLPTEVEQPLVELEVKDPEVAAPVTSVKEAPAPDPMPAAAAIPEANEPVVVQEEAPLPSPVGDVVAADVPASEVAGTADPLDNEIRRAAMASSYELLIAHAPERTIPAGTPPEVPEVVEETRPGAPALSAEAVAPPPAPVVAAAAAPVQKGRRRFTDWLDASTPAAAQASAPVQAPAEKAPSAAATPEPREAAEPAAVPKEKDIPTLDTSTLIDRFIKQQTPPPPPKAEFFTPQQAGKRSLEDAGDMVTETLARIHAQQGNLAKAREAYRKLALKYPEKSAYFAALSEKLEGRSHN